MGHPALQFSLAPSRTDPSAPRPVRQAWSRRAVGPLALAGLLASIFFGFIFYVRATNHWQTHVPSAVYQELAPNANAATHPGF